MNITGRPADIIDLKLDLLGHSLNPDWQAILETELSLVSRNLLPLLTTLPKTIASASMFYVTSDMADMVAWAAASLDNEDRTRIDLAPTSTGIVYFEKGLSVTDVNGWTMIVHLALWFHLPNGGILVFTWNDINNEPDEVHSRLISEGYPLNRRGYGRWEWVGLCHMIDGSPLGPSLTKPYNSNVDATNAARLYHALWLLLGQTITTLTQSPIPRAAERRAQRADISPTVTIINLRRTTSPPHSDLESSREYHHRWLVRGHWRWAHVSEHHPLAEKTNDGYRARLWIIPHIKGPQGKPFKTTDKIYALTR